MIFKWESEDARALRLMRIPAQKKLEWLYEMGRFMRKFTPKGKKIKRFHKDN
jgi:hypothetical protein